MKNRMLALLKAVGVVAFMFTLMGVGQLAQVLHTGDDVRYAAINEWLSLNPGKAHLADAYLTECVKGRDKDAPWQRSKEQDSPHTTITQCGIEIGAKELAEHVSERLSALKSLAWPLSIIE
jgi:hypothetical protein